MSVKIVDNKKKVTYVFFGGVSGGMGLAPFEFSRFSEKLEGNKIFITDDHQAWYSNGIDENTCNIKGTVLYIERIIVRLNTSKVIFCGNSMGGYAALLFGVLLNVDRIIAFSPQTTVSLFWILANRDFRWFRKMLKANVNSKLFPYDIYHVLKKDFKSKIEIFVGESETNDIKHVDRLKGIDGINIYYCSGLDHNLIKTLKSNGKLMEIFKI